MIKLSIFRNEFDELLLQASDGSHDDTQKSTELLPALSVFKSSCRLLIVFDGERDRKRFEKLCKYITNSLHSESIKLSYVGVFLNKEYRYVANNIFYKF